MKTGSALDLPEPPRLADGRFWPKAAANALVRFNLVDGLRIQLPRLNSTKLVEFG